MHKYLPFDFCALCPLWLIIQLALKLICRTHTHLINLENPVILSKLCRDEKSRPCSNVKHRHRRSYLMSESGPTQQAGLTTAAASPRTVAAIVYVTDDAKVIDESTRKQLETTLAALKERKKIDFSVVTMKSTGDKRCATIRLHSLVNGKATALNKTPADCYCSSLLTIGSGTFKSLATSKSN